MTATAKQQLYPPPKETIGQFFLRRIKGVVFHHFWWMRDYELDLFVAFYMSLSEEQRQRLIWQLHRRDVYYRSPKGKILSIGDRLNSSTLNWLKDKRFYLRMMTVPPKRPKSDCIGKKPNDHIDVHFDIYRFTLNFQRCVIVDAKIVVSNGLLTQVEFIKMPKTFRKRAANWRGVFHSEISRILTQPNLSLSEGITSEFLGVTSSDEDDSFWDESLSDGEGHYFEI